MKKKQKKTEKKNKKTLLWLEKEIGI